MSAPTVRSILTRAASDPAYRAKLLADPALGLTADKLQRLIDHPELAEAELSLELLDQIAGGPMSINRGGGGGENEG